MDNGAREIQKELDRLSDRFFVAVFVDIFTRYCKREFDLEEKKKTGGHVAAYWALEFNIWAHICFVMVMFRVVAVPVTLVQMRRIQPEVNTFLVLGFILLAISLGLSSLLG